MTCQCGCQRVRVGEDVSEKLDYTPGVFTVERHIRGKWACKTCETPIQAPVPPHVIDKGIPTAGLLAHTLVSKYGDHLPLYRQERIFARAGLAIPRSALGAWVGVCGVRLQPLVDALHQEILQQGELHADETPVQMLSPGKGKTHRAYLWAYTATQFAGLRAVVYDFADSRAGEHARTFLGDFQGNLVCDDYGGYKAGFQQGIIEIGCAAHPSAILSGENQVAASVHAVNRRLELRIKLDRGHNDCRNASRSALGFHGFAFVGLMPAFFQNACMASRFICRLIVT